MIRSTVLTFGLLAFIGCGPQTHSTDTKVVPVALSQTNGETSSTGEKQAVENAVSVKITSLAELHQAIAKHTGKIVVCDLWSTNCAPCLKEFPHLVELSRKFPSDKLVCISANLDYIGLPDEPPEKLKGPVLAFLTEQKAEFENYMLNEEDSQVYEKLNLASIPAVYVYGVDGKVAKRFDDDGGEFTYDKNINPFVEELLKSAPPAKE